MRQFEWSDLRFFLELVRAGSPSRAGRRLRVDHTTVRRRVAALEDGLQARLFSARGPTYDLTPEGERLLRYAEAVETLTIRAEEAIADRDLALSGTVRIGAPDGFGVRFLAARLVRFSAINPDLQIQLVIMPRVVNLSNREADIAIGYAPPSQNRQMVRRLTDYRLGLYAAPSYLERHPPVAQLADLAQHHIVGYIRDMLHDSELDAVPSIRDDANFTFESTNIFAQVEAVAAGLGISVLPDFIVRGDSRLVRVLPEDFTATRQFWLIVHPEMINIARVRAAIDFITEIVRDDRSIFMGQADAAD